jgi:hypothetical protein
MTEALTDSTFPTDVIAPLVRKAVLDLVSDYLGRVGASVDVSQHRPELDSDMTLTVHIRVPPRP